MNFDTFKVRCSAISCALSNSRSNAPLTELQLKELNDLDAKEKRTIKQDLRLAELIKKQDDSKKVSLSETCIGYLMDEYSWLTTGKIRVNKELDIVQMEKGKLVEPDSITLISLVDRKFYRKNDVRVYNEFLSGEPDIFEGEDIMSATSIHDIKSTWDYPTFLCKINTSVTNENDWQVKGYMEITGATHGQIVNCLINTPDNIVNGIKWRLLNKMNVATEEAPEFKERWSVLERSMFFDNIPPHQRICKQEVLPMTDDERQKLYDRVKLCRQWLNEFHERYQKINIAA